MARSLFTPIQSFVCVPGVMLVVLLSLSLTQTVLSQESGTDWPQWRGSRLDSVSDDTDVPQELGDENLMWRTVLPGPAGSSPIVVGDDVFLTSIDGEGKLLVLCIGVDGKQKWKREVAGKNKDSMDGGNSASSSPCSDGKHLWTMFGNGIVSCFTVAGEPVWTVDLQERYGKFKIQFGMSTTPILVEGQLLFALLHGDMREKKSAEGLLVSLNPETGEENWTHLRMTDGIVENKHSYASPSICKIGDRVCFLVHGGDYTTAHELNDGSEVWRVGGMNPKGQGYDKTLRFVASPVFRDGRVVLPTAKRGPMLALDPNVEGTVDEDELSWKTERITPDVSTPVIYNDLVFLAREKETLACLDLKTGEKHYEERCYAGRQRSTPVACNGVVYIVDRKGKIMIIEASKELNERATRELGEETLSSPAIANGKLYVRTFEALYCFGKAK